MRTRTIILSLVVFMVFLSIMPSGIAEAYFFDGMAPASARDIPVLRFEGINIVKIVFNIISPVLGPFAG